MLILIVAACGPRQPEAAVESPAPAPAALAVQYIEGEGLEADLARSRSFLETRPYYERPLGDGQQVPAGLSSLSAETCGTCHRAIYREWQVSTHAAAWRDRQYQAELQKSGNRWLCLNCHTPLMVQQDYWPVGLQEGDVEYPVLVRNPGFDEGLREEGITCAACHVRDGVIHGPGLSDSAAPHPVQEDPDFRGNAVCLRCHQATATYPGKGFVCTFDTGSEWAAGPYPAEDRHCPDCHMPAAERPAAAGGPERVVAQHWWRGGGIPKVEGVYPPVEANPPGLGLEATWTEEGLALVMSNRSAGHLLPTGDPERWVQVDVRFEGPDGPVGEPWSARIGQRWEWWPEPRKLGDNRLKPRERREELLPVPEGAERAVVVASAHRMSEETRDYHELDGYPIAVETHRLELRRP